MAIKRAIDVVFSLTLLIALSPVLLALALIVACTMGRPVLFNQPRPGLGGRMFRIHKFRTMTDARDAQGELLPDTERLTRMGRFMRAASLDELPELFNVLKGEMSLVGPRPLLSEYSGRYTPEQDRRHGVRPGITGLAQISGRNAITFSKRLDLDVYYVDHWNLWLDLKILLATIPKVLASRGVRMDQNIDEIDDVGLWPASAVARQRQSDTEDS